MARIRIHPQNGPAWVTGASQGLGEGLVEALVGAGYRVAVTARSAEKLSELQAKFPMRVRAYPCDVTDAQAMDAVAEQIRADWGEIGLLIANAGIYLPVAAETPHIGDYQKVFQVNLMGTVHAFAPLLPRMVARRKGHICIISSATGFGGMPTASAYGASKAALINMAECLAIELKRHNVGVSVATPGFIDTPAQTTNSFPKPFMVSPQRAAGEILRGLHRGHFGITFPKRFTWPLKWIYALPTWIYLPLVRRQTGWDKLAEPASIHRLPEAHS